jgi:hypothetical protein
MLPCQPFGSVVEIPEGFQNAGSVGRAGGALAIALVGGSRARGCQIALGFAIH